MLQQWLIKQLHRNKTVVRRIHVAGRGKQAEVDGWGRALTHLAMRTENAAISERKGT